MATGRVKRVPQRSCVACRTPGTKRILLRVVRPPDGPVAFDPTGKANGRGAYVCADRVCIEMAQRQKRLARSLKADVPPEAIAALLAAAEARQAASAVPEEDSEP